MMKLPKEELEARLQEALNHPDIKYNTKWYSSLKYPMKSPSTFDQILESFHPRPMKETAQNITLPIYIGTPWVNKLYNWNCFSAWEKMGTPAHNKKLIVYPPGFPARPYASYHDEVVRWYDYWLKGIDTGIMDEPPIKLFVMGINKWKFENEWPLARTNWTKYYLHPAGGLSTERVKDITKTDTFTQPAPYLDPTVYCLRYSTGPLAVDTEITGPIALYLDATIDIDDTNWMADLVDVDPEGNRQLISVGYLKAKFRALDESKSKPYLPIHPRQDPVPITPRKKTEYAIAMMSASVIFQKGHSMELIIRNQDDILSRLGTWGTYMLPFMQTVTHNIHFGNSYLLLPVIPARAS
jgi:predicted acyl esterase